MTPLLWVLVLVVGAALLVYGLRYEPRRFRLVETEVRLADLPPALDGFTILQVSDLHTRVWSPTEDFVAALAERVPAPDLVVCTGDFIEQPRGLEPCLRALAALRGRFGQWAVLGNNDWISSRTGGLLPGLASIDMRVLADAAVQLDVDGTPCWLGGLGFVNLRRTPAGYERGLARLLDQTGGEVPLVLLCHSPDATREAAAAGVPLMLCGHTHGGQICLPGGHAIRNNLYRTRPPSLTHGLHAVGGTQVFISRGLGMTWPTLRTWCAPEAALLTLRRK